MLFSVEESVDLTGWLKQTGLDASNTAQAFLANEIMRTSDKYVPSDSAKILKTNASVSKDADGIEYRAPYARYHWFGKLMVDPYTGKGSFYDPKTGMHWSRPKTQKVLTDRDMNYQGAPLRGPHWVTRCWIDNKNTILKSFADYINARG